MLAWGKAMGIQVTVLASPKHIQIYTFINTVDTSQTNHNPCLIQRNNSVEEKNIHNNIICESICNKEKMKTNS